MANSSICKFYCCYLYCRIPLLAKSTAYITLNFHYLQIQPPLLPKSITCKFSAPYWNGSTRQILGHESNFKYLSKYRMCRRQNAVKGGVNYTYYSAYTSDRLTVQSASHFRSFLSPMRYWHTDALSALFDVHSVISNWVTRSHREAVLIRHLQYVSLVYMWNIKTHQNIFYKT